MIFQIIEENGVKKIQALTADTGAGAPVGSFVYMYKKSNPSGYLYCDGSTFDETKYPALYQYLGSNVLPDYRECVAVGAEQNTTDTIATHDVYTEGQFKDDQGQKITGAFRGWGFSNGAFADLGHAVQTIQTTGGDGIVENQYFDSSRNTRAGDTTHGKQKAVFIYIKATSGLTENQQENVLNTINENLSYSTTEHKTGKKSIDGKDVYSKSFVYSGATTAMTGISMGSIGSFEDVETINGSLKFSVGTVISLGYMNNDNNKVFEVSIDTSGNVSAISPYSDSNSKIKITVEYTKTTDN